MIQQRPGKASPGPFAAETKEVDMVRWISGASVLPALLFAVTVFAFASFTASQARAASPDNLKGFWTSEEKRDSLIEIYDCGEHLCGRIVSLTKPLDDDGNIRKDINNKKESLQDRPLAGIEFLTGFTYDERKAAWHGGRIYNARDGKTYKSTMVFKDDELNVRGFVGISLFGKTDVWVEVEDSAAAQ
jgi:uncharacterized protein (DUF2147 family)